MTVIITGEPGETVSLSRYESSASRAGREGGKDRDDKGDTGERKGDERETERGEEEGGEMAGSVGRGGGEGRATLDERAFTSLSTHCQLQGEFLETTTIFLVTHSFV